MKRFCTGLLAFCLFVMCGCSSGSTQKNKNIMYVVDGAYNLTPQEYIDLMNQYLRAEGADYPQIPDWDDSEISIDIGSFFTQLSFSTNSEGRITRIHYDWQITKDQKQVDAAYFMIGLTIGMISPQHTTEIENELNLLGTGKSSYITECDVEGSHFYYTCAGYGKYNLLSISPSGLE